MVLVAGCSSVDVGTKIAAMGEGTLASEQKIAGKTILMTPKMEDITEDSFNIRYMEMSFGYGTPENIRDMAIAQCESIGKVAMYKTTSRGSVQLNTVKAYYSCVTAEVVTDAAE